MNMRRRAVLNRSSGAARAMPSSRWGAPVVRLYIYLLQSEKNPLFFAVSEYERRTLLPGGKIGGCAGLLHAGGSSRSRPLTGTAVCFSMISEGIK